MIKTIDVQTLKTLYDQDPNLCLIDVREQYEWDKFHIPHAIHIRKDDITDCIVKHVKSVDQAIYLYCAAGVRSLYAALDLQALGYKNAYSVDGGIMAWAEKEYPVAK